MHRRECRALGAEVDQGHGVSEAAHASHLSLTAPSPFVSPWNVLLITHLKQVSGKSQGGLFLCLQENPALWALGTCRVSCLWCP